MSKVIVPVGVAPPDSVAVSLIGWPRVVALDACVVKAVVALTVKRTNFAANEFPAGEYPMAKLGQILLGDYLVPFEVVSVLLLAVMIGAAYLAKGRRREEEISGRQAEIARSKANVALIDTQLGDTIAVSPVDGVVLVKAADVGEVLAPGATVVTIGDIDHPWLRGYVNETDLGKVKIGSKVRVTSDSFPGKQYNGHVSFISSQAEFTPKQIQTSEERQKLVYRIKIDVDNPQHELKSNMPADAEIAF